MGVREIGEDFNLILTIFYLKNIRKTIKNADGTSAFYVYNHNHQRAAKNANGRYTTYMYSGDLLIQEKSSSHNLKFTYNSVGNPIAVMYNGVEYYYVTNLQGYIIGLIYVFGGKRNV